MRLDTFNEWSPDWPVLPKALAKDGFYCLKTGDRVKCIFCNLVLKNWEQGDIVNEEHKKFNPCCPFLLKRNVGNEPITPEPGKSSGNVKSVPRFPEYSKPAAREGSFRYMPPSMKQSVDDLVQAGFYYMGMFCHLSDNYVLLNMNNQTNYSMIKDFFYAKLFVNCERKQNFSLLYVINCIFFTKSDFFIFWS